MMKATGVVRRIDDLGRIVIPKEIRRTMRIREGDPLEIFTDKDGGVVFKKYSLMGGLSDFAGQMCETLSKLSGLTAVITDRDSTLAVSGASRKELAERAVSEELEKLMESRQLYVYQPDQPQLSVCRDSVLSVSGACRKELSERSVSEELEKLMEGRQLYVAQDGQSHVTICRDSEQYRAMVCAPILSGGDVLGAVLFVQEEGKTAGEAEVKMIQTAAGFLSRHMES